MEEPDRTLMISQFRQLIREIRRGSSDRNCFLPWEIGLLSDIGSCHLPLWACQRVLRCYQRAVITQLNRGAETPMKLSEFLATRRNLRLRRSATSVRRMRGRNLMVRTPPRALSES